MSLKENQPLVTLEISLNLQEVNRAEIPIKKIVGLSDEIAEKVDNILTLISPNLTVVDMARSAACLTPFECNPSDSNIIRAIFQGYTKDDKPK